MLSGNKVLVWKHRCLQPFNICQCNAVTLPNQLQTIIILMTTLTTCTQRGHTLLLLSARLLPHALCLSLVNSRVTQLAFLLTPIYLDLNVCEAANVLLHGMCNRSCGDRAFVSTSLEHVVRNKAERADTGAAAPLGPRQGLLMSDVACLIHENRMHVVATSTWAPLLRSMSEQVAHAARHAARASQVTLRFIPESKLGPTLAGRSVSNPSCLSLLLLIVLLVTKSPCPHWADAAETGEPAGRAAVLYPQVYLRWGWWKSPASAVPNAGTSSSWEQGHWSMTAACRAARGECETWAWGGLITRVVICVCICPQTTAECWWEWPGRCEEGMFAASHLKYLHERWLPLSPAGQQVWSFSLPHFTSYRSEFINAVTRTNVLMLWIIPVTNYWCQQSYSHSLPQHLPFLSLHHTQQYHIVSVCIPWPSTLHLASTKKHMHAHNQVTNFWNKKYTCNT